MPEFPRYAGLVARHGRIDEVWMCRAEVSRELVESVVSNQDTGRDVQHAVFRIEIPDGGAAAGRVAFAKNLLKVAVQKLNNSLLHCPVPRRLCQRNADIARCLDVPIADVQTTISLGRTRFFSDSERRRGCSRPRAEQR